MAIREKWFKRATGIILSLGLLLSVNASVFGAGIPDPNTPRNITIHKFGMEGLTNIPKGTGQLSDQANIPTDAQPMKGIQFEITKVNPENHNLVDPSFPKATLTTGQNGTIKSPNLMDGTYRIHELPNPSVKEPSEDTIISIPLTNPAGDGWIYDVHIFPKNKIEGPTIDKFVTEVGNKHDTDNVKNTPKWIIKSEIPNDMATAMDYTIHDKLDTRLDFVSGSVALYRVDVSGNRVLIPESGYTLTKPSNPERKLTVSLNQTGKTEAAKALPNTDTKQATLELEFKTVINDTALQTLGEAIPNSTTLEYTNGGGYKFKPRTDVEHPEVHTGGVNLLKVDAKDSNIVLRGAKFKIYKSEADAKQGVQAIKDPQDHSKDWEVTTADDGTATFHGLAYGQKGEPADSASTTDYWIVETKAPTDENGKAYNLLRSPVKVSVNATSHNTANKVIIKNFVKEDIPLTGGIVNNTLLGVGFIMLACGVIFFAKKNVKKSSTNN